MFKINFLNFPEKLLNNSKIVSQLWFKGIAESILSKYRYQNTIKIKGKNIWRKTKRSKNKKEYYPNREAIKDKRKEYHATNKEAVKARESIRHKCPCGSIYRHGDKATHFKTKKHQDF